MGRIVSLIVLVAILLIVGALFFEVMADFILPLFLALLLVVMFGPLHRWFKSKCGKHDRLAALLTTAAIILMVLIPVMLLLTKAAYEAQNIYRVAMNSPLMTGDPSAREPGAEKSPDSNIREMADWISKNITHLSTQLGIDLNRKEIEEKIAGVVQQFIAPLALRTTRLLGSAAVGLMVLVLATYYFFADGPLMLETLQRLSPLENSRTQELLDQFDGVTRAVVVATLLSAVVQGLLAGVGFYVAGVGSVFLLTMLSMLLTLVPFIGAAMVWAPVCLWLFVVEARTAAAVLLAAYCITVVSMVDNLLKPMVLHGRSNLHPLLALLSVLGGVEALGPIGILVGPMVVAFLQTLLNMVHDELAYMTQKEPLVDVKPSG